MRIMQYLLLLSLLIALAGSARAIPVFARKYGFQCTMCHTAFPRLNDFGLRYRQNGYQLPGRENEERTVLESPPPFAARLHGGYTSDNFSDTPDAVDVQQFEISGVDILSGGLLGRNIGYIFGYAPRIEGARGLADQPGTVDLANVIFSNIGDSPWLNLRVGRLEGAHTAFSVQRRLTFSPYEIYAFSFPGGIAFADTQTGLEASGHSRMDGWKYAAGWVNGSDTNNSDDGPADFYLRAEKAFGRGEGQTSGQRVGVTGYFGRARPAPELPGTDREDFTRFGVDASLNFKQLNVELEYLTARDAAALWDTADEVTYNGGFAQLNYFPTTNLVGFLRYDLVNAPDDVPIDTGDIRRWTLGGRYYLEDNLAVHLEYSHRTQEFIVGPEGTENFFTTRLDYAF